MTEDPAQLRLARVDGWLTRWRATTPGELSWIGLLTAAITLQAAAWAPAIARPELVDFAAFTDNARAWLAGVPYPEASRDPNTPHALLVFVPFVFLPPGAGLVVWLLLSYAAAGATVRLVMRELSLHPSPQVLVTALALFAVAPLTLDVIANGNMIWPLWWMFTAAWVRARRGHAASAGAIIGVLATVKPFVALWLPYFALRRDWRALRGATAAAGLTLAVSLLLTGRDAWLAWGDMLGRISWYDVRFNASLMGWLVRLNEDPVLLWLGLSAGVAATTVVWLVGRASDLDRDWGLVLMAALLISPLGWRYYEVFALGPLLAWLLRAGTTRGRLWLIGAWLLVPAPALTAHGSVVVRATIGSLMFWLLCAVWIAVGTDSSGRSARP